MSTGKCGSHFSLNKVIFAADRDHHRINTNQKAENDYGGLFSKF